MTREEMIARVEAEKVIAIVRGVEPAKCMPVADALYAGGIRLMEVTFDQKRPESFQDTADAIRAVGEKYGDNMLAGAGTVTSVELVELAAQAGAKYIISPDTNVDVIRRTRELGMLSMPGAMTPTEIMTAHRAGADFVKLFPAADLGAAYVKAVRAPISHVKLLAVGGINERNVGDFLAVGMVGAGIGGNLANKTWIENGEFDKITAAAEAILAAVR
jgi:2-dehydro-3-deoxyphosphogluconate aldolase/(4S)-4-hydroxy-2-oxoglutarate aldolase